ncbi:hypothetical protein AWC22_03390 [Mycobacterium riyadhense]|uniref:Uncharacterized protein n=1 Tax=Mycobacterium riyadhense TaxID=486698 RepID=A0A1X2BIH7_9MYCO|nr:hypothetical protein AWC22_03390 [Mycobacterium riyadhense]
MTADWPIDCFEPNNPSMNSAIVEEGSVASGDGCTSYAARRRNLACRPPALGRLYAVHERLPLTAANQPAETSAPADLHDDRSPRTSRSSHSGRFTPPTTYLDYRRES